VIAAFMFTCAADFATATIAKEVNEGLESIGKRAS
jgi:hypothetical protein